MKKLKQIWMMLFIVEAIDIGPLLLLPVSNMPEIILKQLKFKFMTLIFIYIYLIFCSFMLTVSFLTLLTTGLFQMMDPIH